jgi:enamine deaminase RidA (YjgF/YER057c/UK114 family)
MQAEIIAGNIAKICEAAGTSIGNAVRLSIFLTDMREFYTVYKAFERRAGGRPLPFSAIEVPTPLPAPGATMQIEAWVYAP